MLFRDKDITIEMASLTTKTCTIYSDALTRNFADIEIHIITDTNTKSIFILTKIPLVFGKILFWSYFMKTGL